MMNFDWGLYRNNIKGGGVLWLPERTIYMTRHGSHAYGTNLPTSDEDFRGLAIAPIRYYLGIGEGFEQAEMHEPVDLTVFELRKFVKLAADANPNALEILFTDPNDHVIEHPLMVPLFEAREAFLSQKAKHTFSGYALAQMKRINTHYRWLKNPPPGAPTRAEFGLPERTVIPADQLAAAQANIQKQLDRWSWHELEGIDPAMRQALKDEFLRRLLEITQWGEDLIEEKTWLAASRVVGYDTNFIELLDMERRYTGRLREWQNYQHWLQTRNPARAELEAKWGYDTKHAMHLVRLTRMCKEVLTEGVVRVKRPDAAELLEIRHGAWTYEQLVEYTAAQDIELNELLKTTKLPKLPNRELLSQVCIDTIHNRCTQGDLWGGITSGTHRELPPLEIATPAGFVQVLFWDLDEEHDPLYSGTDRQTITEASIPPAGTIITLHGRQYIVDRIARNSIWSLDVYSDRGNFQTCIRIKKVEAGSEQ